MTWNVQCIVKDVEFYTQIISQNPFSLILIYGTKFQGWFSLLQFPLFLDSNNLVGVSEDVPVPDFLNKKVVPKGNWDDEDLDDNDVKDSWEDEDDNEPPKVCDSSFRSIKF